MTDVSIVEPSCELVLAAGVRDLSQVLEPAKLSACEKAFAVSAVCNVCG